MRISTVLIMMLIPACESGSGGDDGVGFCGDGIVDPGEACDDGNRTSGDGCSSICTEEGAPGECGDGTLDANESCDDGNIASSDGCSSACAVEGKFATTANWQLKDVPDVVTACPNGFDTAAVNSQLVDDNDQAVGAPIIDLFNCADGTGTITPVFQGRYRTSIAITNTDGTQTYATSLSAIVDLTASDQTFSASIFNDGGFFGWSWVLKGAASNNVLTCAAAGAAGGAELVSTNVVSGSQAVSDIFTCEDGAGVTAALIAGTYTISADALNASMQSVGTAPALTDKTITAPNGLTDLGTIEIPIDGL